MGTTALASKIKRHKKTIQARDIDKEKKLLRSIFIAK